MVNNTPHTHYEALFGFLAATAGGATGIALMFAGIHSLLVAALLGGLVAAGIATYGGFGLARARIQTMLGWTFAFVVLMWPLMVFAVAFVVLVTTGGE